MYLIIIMVKRAKGKSSVQKQKQSQSTKQTNKQSVKVSIKLDQSKKSIPRIHSPSSGSESHGPSHSGPSTRGLIPQPIIMYPPGIGTAQGSYAQPMRSTSIQTGLGSVTGVIPLQGQTPQALSMERYNQPPLYQVEQNIPQAQAYRVSPILNPIVEQPVRIENKAGKRIPNHPIQTSSSPSQGYAYEEPYRDFAQIKSYNELVRESKDTQSAIENSVLDSYNLYRNTDPAEPPPEFDDRRSLSSGAEEENQPSFDQPQSSFAQPQQSQESPNRSRGRPYLRFTDEDLTLLEAYLRIKTTLRANQRNPEQKQIYDSGSKLVDNRRNNPYLKPIVDGILARLEDEKK